MNEVEIWEVLWNAISKCYLEGKPTKTEVIEEIISNNPSLENKDKDIIISHLTDIYKRAYE